MSIRHGWALIGAAFALLELVTLRRCTSHGVNDTASACTRAIWRTDRPLGRLIFRICLYGGAIWFDRHIVKGIS